LVDSDAANLRLQDWVSTALGGSTAEPQSGQKESRMGEITLKPTATLKTIGVIGGSTEFATIEYYRQINAAVNRRLGGFYTAEIIIDSMNFAQSAYFVNNALWEEGGAYLQAKAKHLEQSGAAFIICVSNTWHRAAPYFMNGLRIPLLHIADPTAEAIKAARLEKVALLGTLPVMSTPFMIDDFERRGVKIMVPEDDEQRYVDRVIFEEMSKGIFSEEARVRYLEIVDSLQQRGAQGVILGCTEIPMLINQDQRPQLPMFDTLRLHAEAAAHAALT
jgi:aspartate racemase